MDVPVVPEQLLFLEKWYADQCDGDWEHQNGVKLETLDNPGWSLSIDLADTNLHGHCVPWRRVDRSDADWLHYWSNGLRFEARCGAVNLTEAIAAFRSFVETHGAGEDSLTGRSEPLSP